MNFSDWKLKAVQDELLNMQQLLQQRVEQFGGAYTWLGATFVAAATAEQRRSAALQRNMKAREQVASMLSGGQSKSEAVAEGAVAPGGEGRFGARVQLATALLLCRRALEQVKYEAARAEEEEHEERIRKTLSRVLRRAADDVEEG